MTRSSDVDREAGATPFGEAVLEACGGVPPLGKQSYGVVGVHTVGAAAVGDDRGVGRELVDAAGEVVEWHADGTRDVSGRMLGGRPHVDDDDVAVDEPPT